MPVQAKRPCATPGCRQLVPAGDVRCPPHRRSHEQTRGTRTQRGYDNRWLRARAEFLRLHPFCVRCQAADGTLHAATVVDHITPHKGSEALFWNEQNWQPLCKFHHDQKTANEDGGFIRVM